MPESCDFSLPVVPLLYPLFNTNCETYVWNIQGSYQVLTKTTSIIKKISNMSDDFWGGLGKVEGGSKVLAHLTHWSDKWETLAGSFGHVQTQQLHYNVEENNHAEIAYKRWFHSKPGSVYLKSATDPATGTNSLKMFCLATDTKRLLINMEKMFSYFYVLLSSQVALFDRTFKATLFHLSLAIL